LSKAIERSNTEVLRILLDSGADIRGPDNSSESCNNLLHKAVQKRDAHADALDKSGNTPVFVAMSTFYTTSTHLDEITPIIKLLADYGAVVNARNKYNETLLLIAIGDCAEIVFKCL
jgi:ankyrin repeat protein